MRTALVASLALAALLGTACGRNQPTLRVCSWADAVKPEIVTRFQKERGCKVAIDQFDSEEAMSARLAEGAGGGCDLLLTPASAAQRFRQRGQLLDLRREQLPNLVNVDPKYLRIALDGSMTYSVPYALFVTGIGYRASKEPDPERTWRLFDNPRFKGRMSLIDEPRETIGAALKALGYSLNTRDGKQLAAARDVVIRWLRNGARFDATRDGAGLASGDLIIALGGSAVVQLAQGESDDVEFVVPREGAAIAAADLVVPKGARQAGLAHAFINFLHNPRVAAESTEYLAYLCPNAPSYDHIPPELLDDPTVYIPPEVMVRSEVIADLGTDNAKYAGVWSEIKAAR